MGYMIYDQQYEMGLLEHVQKRFISMVLDMIFPSNTALWGVSHFSGQTHLDLCV